MQKKSVSPLKDVPLRNPGQSLDAQIDDLRFDMLQPMMMATLLVALCAVEWLRWYKNDPPHPMLYSWCAAGGIVYAVVRTRRYLVRLRTLKLGRDGEKAVGQYLERLRESGARVLHDIVGKDFNLDHVVISPHGIYVVETKTWSKPVRGDANITYDGEELRANGQKHERDPIKQAMAQARWLRELLKESTGKAFRIQPVIVFPGWYVDATASATAKRKGVWLLNPKALPDFIGAEHTSLAPEDLKLAAFHLSRYVRASSA